MDLAAQCRFDALIVVDSPTDESPKAGVASSLDQYEVAAFDQGQGSDLAAVRCRSTGVSIEEASLSGRVLSADAVARRRGYRIASSSEVTSRWKTSMSTSGFSASAGMRPASASSYVGSAAW